MRERCHESGHVVNVPNVGRERGVSEIEGKPGAEIHVGIVGVLNVMDDGRDSRNQTRKCPNS